MQIDKSEGADFKYANKVFLNSCPKIFKSQAFLVPNLWIFVEVPDFKYGDIVFKFQPKNTQTRLFLVPNLSIFVEGAGFRYDNIVCKFQARNTQMRHFWSKILNTAFLIRDLGIFGFLEYFSIREIWRRGFQLWQYCIQISAPKYPN